MPASAWSRMWQWNIHMPGAVVVADDQLDGPVDRDVDGVLPLERHRRASIEHLEEEAVQVERVREVDRCS